MAFAGVAAWPYERGYNRRFQEDVLRPPTASRFIVNLRDRYCLRAACVAALRIAVLAAVTASVLPLSAASPTHGQEEAAAQNPAAPIVPTTAGQQSTGKQTKSAAASTRKL